MNILVKSLVVILKTRIKFFILCDLQNNSKH